MFPQTVYQSGAFYQKHGVTYSVSPLAYLSYFWQTEKESWHASFLKFCQKGWRHHAWQAGRQTNTLGPVHCASQISFCRTKKMWLVRLRAIHSHFAYVAPLCSAFMVGTVWDCCGWRREAREVSTLLPRNQGWLTVWIHIDPVFKAPSWFFTHFSLVTSLFYLSFVFMSLLLLFDLETMRNMCVLSLKREGQESNETYICFMDTSWL